MKTLGETLGVFILMTVGVLIMKASNQMISPHIVFTKYHFLSQWLSTFHEINYSVMLAYVIVQCTNTYRLLSQIKSLFPTLNIHVRIPKDNFLAPSSEHPFHFNIFS